MDAARYLSELNTYQGGTLWKGYATANPNEARNLDAYLRSLVTATPLPLPTPLTKAGHLGNVLDAALASVPASGSINSWEYGQAIPRRGVGASPHVVDVHTQAELIAAWNMIKPGDSIRGHGITYTGQVALTGKHLAGFSEVDLSDNCLITGPANPAFGAIWFAYNTNVHLYGARCAAAPIITYDLVNCDVMDFLVQKSVTAGIAMFGINAPFQNCVFRGRVEDSSYGCHPVAGGPYYITQVLAASDPHAEKGTGIHGANIGDSSKWVEDSKFVLDFQDVWTGAAIELSNLRKGAIGSGCELWVRAKGLHQPAQSQVSGNGLQFWGSPSMVTNAVTVRYLDVDDAQGRAVEAADLEGPFSGVTVEYARAAATMQNPRLSGSTYRQAAGITYKDAQ